MIKFEILSLKKHKNVWKLLKLSSGNVLEVDND